MDMGKLRDRMTHQLIHRAREFAAFDVPDQNVIQCPHDRPGQRLNAVTLHHN